MGETIPPSGGANRLSKEVSPYLRSASHQPVDWYPWGEEAFAAAQGANKPILLDIGAVWCHWCHVMDTESYENDATARIINSNYVPVKVDRDERPDVDSRYQAAVSAISGQGGWPLTAFLTPEGQVFFGGTYFPPEDRYGRTSFPKVLTLLAETFHREPEKVLQNARRVNEVVQHLSIDTKQAEALSPSILGRALSEIMSHVDFEKGGFGSAPKFPHCNVIELLLSSHDRTKESRMLDAVTVTLRNMAKGGIFDQLGGGFHRYSTDTDWIVPHFEKMLYDNAPLLTNYIHAYQATGDEFFREVAQNILRFSDTVLSDERDGGFYSSQDADISATDDASYFTWSVEAARAILRDDEFDVIRRHFGIASTGQMHTDPTQNVLHIVNESSAIAPILGKTSAQVQAIIDSSKKKMLEARSKRPEPFVDKSIYANWNGAMISAYFEAFKVLRRVDCRDFAVKTLDRILREHLTADGTVSHRASRLAQEGFLDDQVELVNALLSAFESTTEGVYLEKAKSLMRRTIEKFGDKELGGFYDLPVGHTGNGLLNVRSKPIQDSPVAGANSVAISTLLKLSVFTKQDEFRSFAEKSLKHFSGISGRLGMFASRYILSLDEYLNPPPHVAIVSDPKNEKGMDLIVAALCAYRPGKTVSVYDPSLPKALPDVLNAYRNDDSRPVAFVCSQFSCAPPAFDRNTLISTIRSFGRIDSEPAN
jgi:uncharacterized protein